MRKFLILLALLLVGCNSSNGGESPAPGAMQHAPVITALALSPESAAYKVGDGDVTVTAVVTFRDAGLDMQTLWVRTPDGATIEFGESIATETGTFTESFVMSTAQSGVFTIEFWLVDRAGNSSAHRTAEFNVVLVQTGDWTNRLNGLSFGLNDVTWNGNVFVAVGEAGSILTSVDGIDWVARDSGTDKELVAATAFGSHIFAVGDGVILLSTDHGENWTTKYAPDWIYLSAVAFNPPHVVVGGFNGGLAAPYIAFSEDGGDTWEYAGFWPPPDVNLFTDLIYRDGLYIAATSNMSPCCWNEAWVKVSLDGKVWDGIPVLVDYAPLRTITHDGDRFVVAGERGTVLTSFDGFNWTQMQTPVEDVNFMSSAWGGGKLVVAGSTNPPSSRPDGISSIDGGVTWELFNIDDRYQSRGLAWGNGRFVSVGWLYSLPGGAIYTSD